MEDWNSTTHWEPLTGGARVLVSREHTFGTDAVLLADFSAPRPGELWADLGTGCGVIPLPVSYTHLDVYKRQELCQA